MVVLLISQAGQNLYLPGWSELSITQDGTLGAEQAIAHLASVMLYCFPNM